MATVSFIDLIHHFTYSTSNFEAYTFSSVDTSVFVAIHVK